MMDLRLFSGMKLRTKFDTISYEDYVKIINKYREIFGLECFSYKEIDRFNWIFCNLNNEETN